MKWIQEITNAADIHAGLCVELYSFWRVFWIYFNEAERIVMNNAPVVAGAAIGSALMAASGVFSAEGLAVAGAAVIFVVAAFKFISNQNRRRMRPSSSPTEVHEPESVGSAAQRVMGRSGSRREQPVRHNLDRHVNT